MMYLSLLLILFSLLAINKSMAFTRRATGSPRTLEGIPVPRSAGIVAATTSLLVVLPMNQKINDYVNNNDDDDIIEDKKSLLVGSLKTKNMMPKLALPKLAYTITAALLIWNTWWFSPPPSYALSDQDKNDVAEVIQPMFDALNKRMDLTDKKIDLAVVKAGVISSSIGIVTFAINYYEIDDTLKIKRKP